jgi:hypothetical protein
MFPFFAVRWTYNIAVHDFSHAQNPRALKKSFLTIWILLIAESQNGRINIQKVGEENNRKTLFSSHFLRMDVLSNQYSHLRALEACAESDMLLTTKVMIGRPWFMLVLDVGSTGDAGARDGKSAGTRVP